MLPGTQGAGTQETGGTVPVLTAEEMHWCVQGSEQRGGQTVPPRSIPKPKTDPQVLAVYTPLRMPDFTGKEEAPDFSQWGVIMGWHRTVAASVPGAVDEESGKQQDCQGIMG